MSALSINTRHMSQNEFVAMTSFRWTHGAPQERLERGCDHVQDAINYLRAGLRTSARRSRKSNAKPAN